MTQLLKLRRFILLLLLCGALPLRPASAAGQSPDTLRLGLEDALAIALERGFALRLIRLEVEQAEAQVREARGRVLPQLSSSSSYTRDIVSPNPFAGTRALGIIGGEAPTDWLLHNERARTDGDPQTRPLPLPEFQERQEDAFDEAGAGVPGQGGNPFAVPNQFVAGLSLTQSLYDPVASAEIRAARAGRTATVAGARRQAAITVDSVRQAYLAGLLARERTDVFARSVARTRATVEEAARRVEAGAAPVFERLSAEVELGNLETELIAAGSEEAQARDRLMLALGLVPNQPVMLTDPLRVDDAFTLAEVPLEVARARARAQRADLEEARLAVAAQGARLSATRATVRPSVSAFADVSYLGNVPDDRSRVVADPLRPFQVEEERRGFFADDFWNLGASAGVRLSWNLFNGGQLRAQAEQARVGVRQAQLQLQQLESIVLLEVESAMRDLRSARDRALIQQENVRRAERNYELARARVVQGVSTPLERRDASEQLDRSRLNLLQAEHDYLVARSRLLTAVGSPLGDPELERRR